MIWLLIRYVFLVGFATTAVETAIKLARDLARDIENDHDARRRGPLVSIACGRCGERTSVAKDDRGLCYVCKAMHFDAAVDAIEKAADGS